MNTHLRTDGVGKRVIAFSLYGDTPKFTVGAERNAKLVWSVFPGWIARFYIDLQTVPPKTVQRLRALKAEIVDVNTTAYGSQPMFWRFWAAADMSVERFISRDTDSRLLARDAAAVAAWVDSGEAFHILRDHPSHADFPILGGMWGCVRDALPQVTRLISRFPTDGRYMTDMQFLNRVVWPMARGAALQHDSFSCELHEGALPFPSPLDPNGLFIGATFDVDDKIKADEVAALRQVPQPAACACGTSERPKLSWQRDSPWHRTECARLRTVLGIAPARTLASLWPDRHETWVAEGRYHILDCRLPFVSLPLPTEATRRARKGEALRSNVPSSAMAAAASATAASTRPNRKDAKSHLINHELETKNIPSQNKEVKEAMTKAREARNRAMAREVKNGTRPHTKKATTSAAA